MTYEGDISYRVRDLICLLLVYGRLTFASLAFPSPRTLGSLRLVLASPPTAPYRRIGPEPGPEGDIRGERRDSFTSLGRDSEPARAEPRNCRREAT